MKFFLSILAFALPLSLYSQDLVMSANESSNEPTELYRKANQSLTAGDTKNAIEIFDKVIAFYQEEGRENELPESYLGMALSFALNGNYSESIRYHKKALRAHHKYKHKESAEEIEMNLGLAYQLAGKDRKAKKYLGSGFHG